VSCDDFDISTWSKDCKFNHSKLENHQGCLKSEDTINLSVKRKYGDSFITIQNGPDEFLRSHGIQFTIGNYVL